MVEVLNPWKFVFSCTVAQPCVDEGDVLPSKLCKKRVCQNETFDTPSILRGGFPAVWAHSLPPADICSAYYSTYIERDLRQLINVKNLSSFTQFIRLSAGRCGCMFVPSDMSNEIGVDMKTIQHWNSILETSYITFTLPPCFRNIGK